MERRENQKRETGEDIKNLELFLRKNICNIFGIINAVRHGHTAYSEKYPDLTVEGEQAVIRTAEQIVQDTENLSQLAQDEAVDGFKQDILVVSSPQARARATAKIIEARFEQSTNDAIQVKKLDPNADDFNDEGAVRIGKSLRAMDIHNFSQAIELLVSIADGNWTPRRADYLHVNRPEHEERTDLWESRSQVRDRFIKALSSACMILHRYQEKFQDIPRVIAASHFEGLNPLLIEVFNLSPREEHDELLERGEGYTIYLLRAQDLVHIPMVITFRNRAKKVIFNRQNKTFS